MENNQLSVARNAMNYGAVAGLIMVILGVLFYITGNALSDWQQWLDYGAMTVLIVIGTRTYRDTVLNGYMGYGQCLGSGVLISLFSGIISAFYVYIFFSFIDPGMANTIIDKVESDMSEKGMPDDQIEMSMQYTRMFMTPLWMTIWVLLGTVFWGFIISLITSIFLQKKNPQFTDVNQN